MAEGLRVVGIVELSRTCNAAQRTAAIRNVVARLLPAAGNGTKWLGFRPCMPDLLLVIGRSPKTDRILYAFGHGHLGLTLAGLTNLLVRDLIPNQKPQLDITTSFVKALLSNARSRSGKY